jgi:hypothetical protein
MSSITPSHEPTGENIASPEVSQLLASPDDFDFHFSESGDSPIIAKGSISGKSDLNSVKSN